MSFIQNTKKYFNGFTSTIKKYKIDVKIKNIWVWIKKEYNK